MRKIVLLFFTVLSLSASVLEIEQKIYRTVLSAIFPDKKSIIVWTDKPEKKVIYEKIEGTKITNDIKKADILFVHNPKTLTNLNTYKVIIFVGNYALLKKYQNVAIGGFFWQKGRPNIVFIKKNLQKLNINLPKTFEEFIEDSV
ncbi:hypothetical protein [Nitrosophilus alvini]|uniref:hypothetical protein n=1 Tax=Nitrosophilus alvini TaxID=2714855 RepID=UPI00190D2F33|nr:hypothetical protein [Nitrosophilus alvini]